MRAVAILLALTLAGCDSPPQIVFADAEITLPDDPIDLPPGPGREVVLENCIACHSPSTMLQQPRMPREKWVSIAEKMISIYEAPVDPELIPQIADYFVAVQTAEEERKSASTGR